MNIESNLDNNTLVVEKNPLSPTADTVDYSLDSIENLVSDEAQLNSIQSENIEPLPVTEGSSNELVFIDSNVKDSQVLIDNLVPDISGVEDVVVLNSDQDELLQITEHLSNYEGSLDVVHIVSHGEEGELSFANAEVNSDTLPKYEEMLKEWGLALDDDADLLLYGCNVSSNPTGNSFVEKVSQLTGADIAASVDDTGIEGDWELETVVGEVETTSAFNEDIASLYNHTLVDASVNESFGGGGGGSGGGGGEFGGGGDRPVDGNNDSDGEDDDDNDGSGSGGNFPTDEIVDGDWYFKQYPDVKDNGVSAEEHYYNSGRFENRYPNPTFESVATSPKLLVGSVDFAGDDWKEFQRKANNPQLRSNEVAQAVEVGVVLYYVLGGAITLGIGAYSRKLINESNSMREMLNRSRNDIYITPAPQVGPLQKGRELVGFPRPQSELEFIKTPPLDFTKVNAVNFESFPRGSKFVEVLDDARFEFPTEDQGTFLDRVNSGDSNDADLGSEDVWGQEYLSNDRQVLIDELAALGVKHNPSEIIQIVRSPSTGKVIFLENGDDVRGLNHIIKEHAGQFAQKGISEDEIPDLVINALTEGKIVGSQSPSRFIYETTFKGVKQRVAITVGDNGYIVGANPRSVPKK